MLMIFAKAIEAKLDEQSGGGEAKDGKAQQPAVKVTTVKYLAQLLNEPLFVSPRESLSILSSLFRKSTHRDIHYAIAESMLAMIAGAAIPGTPSLADLTLQALQALIPVVGRLNERTEIQEKDWMAFGQGGKIPPIEDKDSTPPLLSLLLEYASKSTLSETVRRRLVEDIILPAYETSRTAYNRWVAVILSRFNALEDLEILSSIPLRPVALAAMLRRIPELLSEEYFMEWHNYVKTNLAPSTDLPAAIYRLAENLRSESTSDPTLTQDTNASSHWMQFLDQRTNIFGAFSLASLLQRPQARSSLCLSDGLISLLQKIALEQADILIKEFDKLNRSWRDFLAPLRGCGRKPQFLPPSFDLRLALIAAIGEDEHVKIAEEVSSLLRNIIASGRPYHHELDQIKNRILNSLGTAAQVQVACCLGELEDNNDAEPLVIDFLRVDLAHWLLRKADQRRDGSEAVREAFEKSELILSDWSRRKIEEFRIRGAVRFDRVAWTDFD
ncbi:MAG: hypothetical protein Q9199_002516 [Rusavskia elegans]